MNVLKLLKTRPTSFCVNYICLFIHLRISNGSWNNLVFAMVLTVRSEPKVSFLPAIIYLCNIFTFILYYIFALCTIIFMLYLYIIFIYILIFI